MQKYRNLISVVIIALLLASCASTEVKEEEPVEEIESTEESQDSKSPNLAKIKKLIETEQFIEAAMMYFKVANTVDGSERTSYQLKAISMLLEEELFDIAINLLAEIDTKKLSDAQKSQYAFLNAKISVSQRDANDSIKWLNEIDEDVYSEFIEESEFLKLAISIYELAGNQQSAIRMRIQREPLLLKTSEVEENQLAILNNLLSIPLDDLSQQFEQEESKSIKSWLELSLTIKRASNPYRLGSALQTWKKLNPTHSIRNSVLATFAPVQIEQSKPINNIALLLPLSGRYAKAASAIRDGFLVSYYSEDDTQKKPSIRLYDTGGKNNDIVETYHLAVSNGADIVIGPLSKKNVSRVANEVTHSIPTLVLNQLENNDNFYSENFYQFSLSPTEEAKQAARRAWFDGLNRAATITPDNSWGTRVSDAFKKEWLELGGEIVAEVPYKNKKNDFSKPIKNLLAIDKSEVRKSSLSKLLRVKLNSEPRRRQDIDFVFMGAFPRQAHLIPPQLEFYHAGDIPIYTTSHSFSGNINAKKDRDLNRVIIGDMPWTLSNTADDNIKIQVHQTWPNKVVQFNRFYALGVDTYKSLNFLSWLRANSNSSIQGVTGKLKMNEKNQIIRELSWAKFRNGKPRLLPTNMNINKN